MKCAILLVTIDKIKEEGGVAREYVREVFLGCPLFRQLLAQLDECSFTLVDGAATKGGVDLKAS